MRTEKAKTKTTSTDSRLATGFPCFDAAHFAAVSAKNHQQSEGNAVFVMQSVLDKRTTICKHLQQLS